MNHAVIDRIKQCYADEVVIVIINNDHSLCYRSCPIINAYLA